jgi:ElaB/YqjD/DUF883 family membrane-anchored ribosome-binding protein
MDTVGVVFLGVIALSSLIQGALLLMLARGGLRLTRRIQDLQTRIEREVKPILDDVNAVSRNVAQVSDLASAQVHRIQDVIAETTRKIEDTREEIKAVLAHPVAALGDAVAFLKGVRRGLEVYRQLGGFEAHTKGSTRRYADDEHLFI